MTTILAITNTAPDDQIIRDVARQVAEVFGPNVAALDTAADDLDRLLDSIEDRSCALAVLRVEQSEEANCWHVISRSSKPVVLVPPRARVRTNGIHRVLLPLDGSPESSAAMAEIVELLSTAPIDIVALHVFAEEDAPPYLDQAAHAWESWSSAFLAEHVAAAGAALEIRMGSPGEHILAVADQEGVDMVALGWSQRLTPGRAQTVRRTILDAPVPVLLAPV